MKTVIAILSGAASLFAAFSLPAAPSEAAIGEARAECHRLKQDVAARGSFAPDQLELAWEEACAKASLLMDQAAGKEPILSARERSGQADAAALEAKPAATPEQDAAPPEEAPASEEATPQPDEAAPQP